MFFEKWPGLEDVTHHPFLTRNQSRSNPPHSANSFGFEKLDDAIGKILNGLVKFIDDQSCLGERGIRLVLVVFILMIAFGLLRFSFIPLLVLLGSVVRFHFVEKQNLFSPVSGPQSTEKEVEEAIFKPTQPEPEMKNLLHFDHEVPEAPVIEPKKTKKDLRKIKVKAK